MKYNLENNKFRLNESEIIEQILFEMPGEHIKRPIVLDVQETILTLLNSNNSICRFGDGEISLIRDVSIPFQDSDKILSERLKEILNFTGNGLMIGINQHYYTSLENLLPGVRYFYRTWVPKNREVFTKLLNLEKIYYSAQFNQVYMTYEKYDFENYYNLIRKIWDKKKLAIICGDKVFSKIRYNIFDNAESIEYLYFPSTNAFNHYDEILHESLKLDKQKIIITILGPTGKVLTFDLYNAGYRVLDLGHLAKDYDWFKLKKPRNEHKIYEFFMPDV